MAVVAPALTETQGATKSQSEFARGWPVLAWRRRDLLPAGRRIARGPVGRRRAIAGRRLRRRIGLGGGGNGLEGEAGHQPYSQDLRRHASGLRLHRDLLLKPGAPNRGLGLSQI